MQHQELFPGKDLVEKELDALRNAKVGDEKTPFAKTKCDAEEVATLVNKQIQYEENVAAIFRQMSAQFSRDNVGLPGCALLFKVYSQIEVCEIWKAIEFLTMRGQHPTIGAHEAPPPTFHSKDESDVLYCFEKALALFKVGYMKTNELAMVACDKADAHAVFEGQCCAKACSLKIERFSHYIAHLKLVQDDKHAIKRFDCSLPKDCEDLAKETAIESVCPSRYMMNPVLRNYKRQAEQVDFECAALKPEKFMHSWETATF